MSGLRKYKMTEDGQECQVGLNESSLCEDDESNDDLNEKKKKKNLGESGLNTYHWGNDSTIK